MNKKCQCAFIMEENQQFHDLNTVDGELVFNGIKVINVGHLSISH